MKSSANKCGSENDLKLLLVNTNTNVVEEYSFSSSKAYLALQSANLIPVSPNNELVAVSDSTGKYNFYKTEDKNVANNKVISTNSVAPWAPTDLVFSYLI